MSTYHKTVKNSDELLELINDIEPDEILLSFGMNSPMYAVGINSSFLLVDPMDFKRQLREKGKLEPENRPDDILTKVFTFADCTRLYITLKDKNMLG